MHMAILETMYGSDQAGLVCAYLFRPGERGCAIESTVASDLLGSGFDGESPAVNRFFRQSAMSGYCWTGMN